MARSSRLSRHQEIQRVRSELELTGFPRFQMLFLVALTGLAGLATSFALLQLGLTEMWLRYLLALGAAYLIYLLLLWVWLRSRGDDFGDLPDLSGLGDSSSGAHDHSSDICGHGGEFGGGGASGSFDEPPGDMPTSVDAGPVGDALSSAAGADEFAIPLAAIVLFVALFLSSLFLIYSAPVLFAELVVDGVLSASLYRKLRGLSTRHWLETAVRRTIWPFAMTAMAVSCAGLAMSHYAPDAHSLGEVISHARQSRP